MNKFSQYKYLLNKEIWQWSQRIPKQCIPTKISKHYQSKLETITEEMITFQEQLLFKNNLISKNLNEHSILELKSLIITLHPRGIIDKPTGRGKDLKNTLIKKIARVTAHFMENKWGNEVIGITDSAQYNGNWTTKLGETFVKEVCDVLGDNPLSITQKKDPDSFTINPDIETKNSIIEVKTNNWTMPGTAGEKILGTPYKYMSVPEIYGKPLKIVCLAYQIVEAEKWCLFGNSNSPLRNKLILSYKEMGIEFIPISQLLNQVKLKFPQQFSDYP